MADAINVIRGLFPTVEKSPPIGEAPRGTWPPFNAKINKAYKGKK